MRACKTESPFTLWMVCALFLVIALLIWCWFDHRIEAIDASIEIIQTQ